MQNNIPTGSAANNFLNALKSFKENEIKEYDYVTFADQDDIWLPKKLSHAIKKIKLEKNIAGIKVNHSAVILDLSVTFLM